MFDATWGYVFATDEMRLSLGDTGAATYLPIGSPFFSAEFARFRVSVNRGGFVQPEYRRAHFLEIAPYVLASTPGGREELRRLVDPEFANLVDELQPKELPAVRPGFTVSTTFAGIDVDNSVTYFRIDDGHGHLAGFCSLSKPAAGMSHLSALASTADPAHLERMQAVEHADRRPAAILMADLEASSPLARRLSTASYFAFSRRLVHAADQCVVDAGGIVGRHTGDGIVAFFLPETIGSESAAARSCIIAARALRDTLTEIAARTEIPASELSLRFGLHWGATPYIGRILTAGRSEVTALGDEVNEGARIEACRDRRPRTRLQVAHRTTQPRSTRTRSESIPVTPRTRRSPISLRRPTRHDVTPPRSPSATSEPPRQSADRDTTSASIATTDPFATSTRQPLPSIDATPTTGPTTIPAESR